MSNNFFILLPGNKDSDNEDLVTTPSSVPTNAINKSRKTRSERDRRRSSRLSLLEQKDSDSSSTTSSSENSCPESPTNERHQQQQQQQQPAAVRYRKRAGSKRVESSSTVQNPDTSSNNNNLNDAAKESIEARRKRTGSKNIKRLSITILPESTEAPLEHSNLPSFRPNLMTADPTATLQMNGKDIYSGTWNPKERAVLDQMLNNMGGSTDGEGVTPNHQKKSFINLFKRSKPTQQQQQQKLQQASLPEKTTKEKQIDKILEELEEELGVVGTTSIDNIDYSNKTDLKYPLDRYVDNNGCVIEQNIKNKRSNNSNGSNKFGIFRRIKETVKQRHEEAFLDRQLQHYLPSPSVKKKAGFFGKFSHNSKSNSKQSSSKRRSRALSSNDYARSVGVFVNDDSVLTDDCTNNNNSRSTSKNEASKASVSSTTKQQRGNLSKSKSGSFRNLFSHNNPRSKSVENLNGAFEYYANPKQVFQRTPSMSKLNSRAVSTEKLNQQKHPMKRSSSQKSLDHHHHQQQYPLDEHHAFAPVQLTAKELCYDDVSPCAHPMVYAQTRFTQKTQNTPAVSASVPASPHLQSKYHHLHRHQQLEQNHRHSPRSNKDPQSRFCPTQLPNQHYPQSDGYCSAHEEDLYRGYQSDISPAMHQQQQQQHQHRYNKRFTFEQPPSSLAPPDTSASSHYQQIQQHQHQQQHYYTPHQHHGQGNQANNYYANGTNNMQFYQRTPPPPPMSPYFLPTQHAFPLPGYYTPGYATPGAVFPLSGNETPNGYASESDYACYAQYSPHFRRHQQQQQSGYVAYQSRRAVQRSLSKNSSTNSNHSGNYGYTSESSFCDEDIYSMVQPPPQRFSPRQFPLTAQTTAMIGGEAYKNNVIESNTNYDSPSNCRKSTTATPNHYQLTTEV